MTFLLFLKDDNAFTGLNLGRFSWSGPSQPSSYNYGTDWQGQSSHATGPNQPSSFNYGPNWQGQSSQMPGPSQPFPYSCGSDWQGQSSQMAGPSQPSTYPTQYQNEISNETEWQQFFDFFSQV